MPTIADFAALNPRYRSGIMDSGLARKGSRPGMTDLANSVTLRCEGEA